MGYTGSMEPFDHLDDEALEKQAWHIIPVARLKKLCNPWGGLGRA